MKQIIKIFTLIGFVFVTCTSCNDNPIMQRDWTYNLYIDYVFSNKTNQYIITETRYEPDPGSYWGEITEIRKFYIPAGDTTYRIFRPHPAGPIASDSPYNAEMYWDIEPILLGWVKEINAKAFVTGSEYLQKKLTYIAIYNKDHELLQKWASDDLGKYSPFNPYYLRCVIQSKQLGKEYRSNWLKVQCIYDITEECINSNDSSIAPPAEE